MGYIRGEAREQTTMFPVTLDELIPADHLCRVIEAFAARLNLGRLGFVRAEPAETGRPGYDPRDLLKLYLYGYLQQIRSSRRLEAECCRNVEVMWLLQRVTPDHKSIAEFRRMHREAMRRLLFRKSSLTLQRHGLPILRWSTCALQIPYLCVEAHFSIV
jgi:transposase